MPVSSLKNVFKLKVVFFFSKFITVFLTELDILVVAILSKVKTSYNFAFTIHFRLTKTTPKATYEEKN